MFNCCTGNRHAVLAILAILAVLRQQDILEERNPLQQLSESESGGRPVGTQTRLSQLLQPFKHFKSNISCFSVNSIAMSSAGRILLCALIPVLLSALRQAQEGEHANTVLQAHESGHESKWTQCCVTKNTGSLKIQSRAFRREAERILQDITYTGAYGPSDAFHTGRYVKHCRLALQLESCPGVHKTLFDLYEYADAGELITRIETFVAKYTFQSESYVWSAPDCPYKMESATDAGRCNSDLGHFMKLLDLWREGLRLVEQVNLYKGWRGYFDKKTKALAKKQLDNVLARLETLW